MRSEVKLVWILIAAVAVAATICLTSCQQAPQSSNDHQSWEEFSEPEGEYSISIPTKLNGLPLEQEFSDGVLRVRISADSDEVESPSLNFQIDQNPDRLSVVGYCDGDPGTDLYGQSFGEFEQTTIAGRSAVIFDPVVTLAGEIIVVIDGGDRFLVIRDDSKRFEESGALDQILDSLQF